MKESKMVSTIINNIGDKNHYKDTTDYLFEVIFPSDKKYIEFMEEYVTLEPECIEKLGEDKEYCSLLKDNLDRVAKSVKKENVELAVAEFMEMFDTIKNNYMIRLKNVQMLKLVNPDLYHN